MKIKEKNKFKALNTLKSDNEKFTIKDVIPKSAFATDEAKEELDKINEIEKNVDREKINL